MTTDQLIALLTADLTPVNRGRVARALTVAITAGAIMAFSVMFLLFGLRSENFGGSYLRFELVKLLFTSSIVVTTAIFLRRLACPGEVSHRFYAVVSVPFAVITVAALASAHWSTGGAAVRETWLTCLFFIPLLAAGPFVAIVCALRSGAPTEFVATGVAAGLVAGGLGAMACSLPCLDDSIPSIAIPYGMMIAICGAAGAKLGPRLLRW